MEYFRLEEDKVWRGPSCDETVATKEEAVEWVTVHKGIVCKIIRSFIRSICDDDLEELCRDAYIVAIEAVHIATRKGVSFQSVFTFNFSRHVRKVGKSYHVIVTVDPLLLAKTPSPYPSLDVVVAQGDAERNLQHTLNSAKAILSGAESELFSLFVGETDKGACTFTEAIEILGIPAGQLGTLYQRMRHKLSAAGRMIDRDGKMVLFSWKKRKSQPGFQVRTDSKRMAMGG